MAHTNHTHGHAHAPDPVEGDGVSYRGIVWFVGILALTVVVSEGLMVGVFKWLEHDTISQDAPRVPLAAPAGQMPPAPNLLYLHTGSPQLSEPGNLEQFRAKEDAILKGYALDSATGVVRIPIDRAKALLLERGLPAGTPVATPAKAEKQ